MNTGTTAVTAALTAALLLTACGGPPDTAATSASRSPGPAGGFKIGEEARNGGTVVEINKVHEVDGILMDGGTKSAGAEAKYVALEAVVLNGTKSGMDLTCSAPVLSSLIDDQGRRYGVIDGLDKIPGNPECDERLQPGSKDQMVFAYRVPKSAKITAWEFSESGQEPSTVDLGGTPGAT
ncbi:DUF4352 domain-containing protein [Streptomyces cellulosae]|uniref:hypothetical protein n=1 Tax=Streptomyces cellulosae TaxID=1968 RepID=UPI0004C7E386|nr:hypothetical protein [Streptomyces cellulosae]